MCDGVAESKTMASVDFSENQVSHWTRIQIYHQMTRPRDKSDLKFYNESPVHGQTFGRGNGSRLDFETPSMFIAQGGGDMLHSSQDERDLLAPSAASFNDTVNDGSISIVESAHGS